MHFSSHKVWSSYAVCSPNYIQYKKNWAWTTNTSKKAEEKILTVQVDLLLSDAC